MRASTLRLSLSPGGVALALLFIILWVAACVRAKTPALDVASQLEGEGNQLLVGTDEGGLWIEVQSESGIGQATITMTAGLPVSATLRLHLAGLEHLQLSNGATTLVAQVSSQADHAIRQAVAEASTPVSAAQPLTPDQPLWLEITPPSAAHPYFTVILPPAFLAAIDRTLTIGWVDFYR
jgi:hypothetical protein